MTLSEAQSTLRAARAHVYDALHAGDQPRLQRALKIEAMWERICDRKQAELQTPRPIRSRAVRMALDVSAP